MPTIDPPTIGRISLFIFHLFPPTFTKTFPMKKYMFLLLVLAGCGSSKEAPLTDIQKIDRFLTQWHQAAAKAQFNAYFEAFTEDAIFIGTDATEHWDKTAFQAYAQPYFDRGKAWSFTAVERHIVVSTDKKMAWFDELLDTQMKLCRGSGVLLQTEQGWKIQHYVLSMTVPNEEVEAVVKLKAAREDALLRDLKTKK